MPTIPALPSVSLPSMPDLSLPDFSDATGRVMAEFNAFTQQVGDALPILEQMGYEVTIFKVTWGLPPKARLRLKSTGNTDLPKLNAIAAKRRAEAFWFRHSSRALRRQSASKARSDSGPRTSM